MLTPDENTEGQKVHAPDRDHAARTWHRREGDTASANPEVTLLAILLFGQLIFIEHLLQHDLVSAFWSIYWERWNKREIKTDCCTLYVDPEHDEGRS